MLSIIIPTLNAAPTLAVTLDGLSEAEGAEIVIADGGSSFMVVNTVETQVGVSGGGTAAGGSGQSDYSAGERGTPLGRRRRPAADRWRRSWPWRL